MESLVELPLSTVVEVLGLISPSFGRGVEGITRKNESVLLILLDLLLTGRESERDIRF